MAFKIDYKIWNERVQNIITQRYDSLWTACEYKTTIKTNTWKVINSKSTKTATQ